MVEEKEISHYFVRMHQVLSLPEYNNATIVGQYLMDAICDFKISLFYIETLFRKMESRVYLVGFPISFFTDTDEYVSRVPGVEGNLKYALWVEVNGKTALDRLIAEKKLVDIDWKMEQTGFLCVLNKKKRKKYIVL